MSNKERNLGYILVLPIVLWIMIVLIYPFIRTFLTSFYNVKIQLKGAPFFGFNNYKRLLLDDPDFWKVFLNSVIWTIGNIGVQFSVGLGVALLLKQTLKGVRLMRIGIIVPWVTPVVVLTIMWRWMLSASMGIFNKFLLAIGLISKPIVFLGPGNAMGTIIMIQSWRYFPFVAVVFLAKLLSIPEELYDSASVDGASTLQKFRCITLPFLKSLAMIFGLLAIIWTFNTFDVIWLITQGGPGKETTTLPVMIYEKSFMVFRMGQGAALSVVMFVFSLILMLIYMRFTLRET